MKTFIIRLSKNPSVFKGEYIGMLPLHYRSNEYVQMTLIVFEDWFIQTFAPEILQ